MAYLKLVLIILFLSLFLLTSSPVAFAFDQFSLADNKVGIGVLSPEADIDGAAQMINANGDWGWVVIIIKKSERNVDRWQGVFHQLSKAHLIPIVRIATDQGASGWQKPSSGDAQDWADFLSKLYFPTKYKYVQVYNEVNRAGEWGGSVDPVEYANRLNDTITALKAKSSDFFILNAPLDLSAPNNNQSMDASLFYQKMEGADNGIFKKLDGWASHSYPNPDFSAPPTSSGRTSISGYKWELSQIEPFIGGKQLPVFITETGWRRSAVLGEDIIAGYYEQAFKTAWNDPVVVAVCPFIYDYKEEPFSAFSFKANGLPIIGKDFYSYYTKLKDLQKNVGKPVIEDKSSDLSLDLPYFITDTFAESASLTLRNTGNYIWKVGNGFDAKISGNFETSDFKWSKEEILPGDEATVTFKIKSSHLGKIPAFVDILSGNKLIGEGSVDILGESYTDHIKRIFNELI